MTSEPSDLCLLMNPCTSNMIFKKSWAVFTMSSAMVLCHLDWYQFLAISVRRQPAQPRQMSGIPLLQFIFQLP